MGWIRRDSGAYGARVRHCEAELVVPVDSAYARRPAMRIAPIAPRFHLFVCTNSRPEDSPLGPGCAGAGDEVYARLKDEVTLRSRVNDVWVTRTQCLGICPRVGATVAVYPRGCILTEVDPADVPALYAREIGEERR
jgi:(2Fe-2S) ferredoxin